MKKGEKSGFTKNVIISKLKEIFASEFNATILKPITEFCENLNYLSLELIRNKSSNSVTARPVRHGFRLFGPKETFFVQ